MFKKELKDACKQINIDLEESQLEKFEQYKNLILAWNDSINLTAITDEKEMIIKHFVDSLTVAKYIDKGDSVIDIGTGAGFPGIPLCIYFKEQISMTLVDSLNKKVMVLKDIIDKLNIVNVTAIHARAEELGRDILYREQYDKVISRAVSNANALSEYLIPLVSIGKKAIFMKGPGYKEELETALVAIQILGGQVEKVDEFKLKNKEEVLERNIIVINKVKTTPKSYPRSSSQIKSKQIK